MADDRSTPKYPERAQATGNQIKTITTKIKDHKALPKTLQDQDPEKLEDLEMEKSSLRQLINEMTTSKSSIS